MPICTFYTVMVSNKYFIQITCKLFFIARNKMNLKHVYIITNYRFSIFLSLFCVLPSVIFKDTVIIIIFRDLFNLIIFKGTVIIIIFRDSVIIIIFKDSVITSSLGTLSSSSSLGTLT